MGKVVEGIQVPNRAQTLNLPISPTAVVGAMRMAGRLASGVREAISFDDVLHQNKAADAAEPGAEPLSEAEESPSVVELLQQTVEAIREKLRASGLATDQPLEMRVDQDAELEMVSDHPQAAAIETLLAGDSGVRSMVSRLHRAGGPQTLSVPPTAAALPARNRPGGPS